MQTGTAKASIRKNDRSGSAHATALGGPRILFFSGGSALNETAGRLKRLTTNSIHLITPFDNGGSSRVLRDAFDMPAVGDLRSRLLALSDEQVPGQAAARALLSHRISATAAPEQARLEALAICSGVHPLIRALADPARGVFTSLLRGFADAVPEDFDFRHASVGNLVLAGGYLSNGRRLQPVVDLLARMLKVQGDVRAVVDTSLNLGADLADGQRLVGQRFLSGKETAPIPSAVTDCFLIGEAGFETVQLPEANRRLIERAEMICYPPGSLYSSVVANLLPSGVGRAVAARDVPKVYVPALGTDPETCGHDLVDQIAAILKPLRADAGRSRPASHFMTDVLCDTRVDAQVCADVWARHGIACHRLPLAVAGTDRYDPQRLAERLVARAA